MRITSLKVVMLICDHYEPCLKALHWLSSVSLKSHLGSTYVIYSSHKCIEKSYVVDVNTSSWFPI